MLRKDAETVYRVDKFVVPEAGRAEFLDAARETHAVLRRQKGFVDDVLLEQESGSGRFNFVTIAIWESAAAMPTAAKAVLDMRAQKGIDAQALLERHGIEADMVNYGVIAARA